MGAPPLPLGQAFFSWDLWGGGRVLMLLAFRSRWAVGVSEDREEEAGRIQAGQSCERHGV